MSEEYDPLTPEYCPKDHLNAVANPKNCNEWYLLTDDMIMVGRINCIVAEAFAKNMVRVWNESLQQPEQSK